MFSRGVERHDRFVEKAQLDRWTAGQWFLLWSPAVKGADMVRRFEKIGGNAIEIILGQNRLAYALSRTEDFYDVVDWMTDRTYPGSQILFYDLTNGKVYTPFANEANVVYGKPVYSDGAYYFLRGDFNAEIITLLRYEPASTPEEIKAFKVDDLNLYNLELIGEPVRVVSQTIGERFDCYYPERFSLPLGNQESVVLIEDGKVYIDKWIEEGEAPDFRYYDRTIVKDFSGKLISDEIGALTPTPDGTWWIS